MSTRTALEAVLELEQIAGSNVFVGQPREGSKSGATRTHLFGGLIAAQSVVAASRTVPATHRIHSLHSYFILAGDGRMPILFRVEEIRNGGSFLTRQVLATQENKTIFMMMASFAKHEPGPEFQRTPEELVALLDALLPAAGSTREQHRAGRGLLKLPQQILQDGHQLHYGNNNRDTASLPLFSGLNHSLSWRKHLGTVNETAGTPGWIMHAALLAYMSDEGLLSTVRQPYATTPISMSTSLDHTIHFHRDFRSDEWLLFHNETTVSSGARGVARTQVCISLARV
jgi:acyl-CoA thioesterase II